MRLITIAITDNDGCEVVDGENLADMLGCDEMMCCVMEATHPVLRAREGVLPRYMQTPAQHVAHKAWRDGIDQRCREREQESE